MNKTTAMPKSFIDIFYLLFAGASAVFCFGYLYWNSLWLILIYLAAINVITMRVYSHDKNASRRGQRRTREGCLMWCNLLGGWIGAIFAQQWLRHKTRKISFQFYFITSTMFNIFLVYVNRDYILSWNYIFE